MDDAQREKISRELIANFELLGMSNSDVQEALGFTPAQLNETLTVGPGARLDDLRRLQGFLERKILEQGDEPLPFSLF